MPSSAVMTHETVRREARKVLLVADGGEIDISRMGTQLTTRCPKEYRALGMKLGAFFDRNKDLFERFNNNERVRLSEKKEKVTSSAPATYTTSDVETLLDKADSEPARYKAGLVIGMHQHTDTRSSIPLRKAPPCLDFYLLSCSNGSSAPASFPQGKLSWEASEVLNRLLGMPQLIKVAHDTHELLGPWTAEAGWQPAVTHAAGVLDIQLAYELATHLQTGRGVPNASLEDIVAYFGGSSVKGSGWATASAELARLYAGVRKALLDRGVEVVLRATATRMERALRGERRRHISFCPQKAYSVMSMELFHALAYDSLNAGAGELQSLPLVDVDITDLQKLLPEEFKTMFEPSSPLLWKVRDIALDKGRSPFALTLSGEKVMLEIAAKEQGRETRAAEKRGGGFQPFGGVFAQNKREEKDGCRQPPPNLVIEKTNKCIEDIARTLDFGPDNRASFDQQLHRVSAIRDNRGNVIGITMRVGRFVKGSASFMQDLLFCKPEGAQAQPGPSILLVGPPGCGKTSILRDIAYQLSTTSVQADGVMDNVFVVDTSNEIGGDGVVPHPAIGDARRMMVRTKSEQKTVMIECVQNHTPDVIVIDEISLRAEVDAAKTVKERGVRLIGSAHGSFESLLRNGELKGLLGGVEKVMLGDALAKSDNGGNKMQTQRGGDPIFDYIVELQPGPSCFDKWSIINVKRAVDSRLHNGKYTAEVRERVRSGGEEGGQTTEALTTKVETFGGGKSDGF